MSDSAGTPFVASVFVSFCPIVPKATEYPQATKIAPAVMFPRVTGSKLAAKNFPIKQNVLFFNRNALDCGKKECNIEFFYRK